MFLRRVAAWTFMLCLPPLGPAMAREDDSDAGSRPDRLTIAIGAALLPSYEGSDDYRTAPVVVARGRVSDISFFTRGTNLYLGLVSRRNRDGWSIEAGPALNVRLDRHGRAGDAQVKALGKTGNAFELGGWFRLSKTGVLTSAHDSIALRVAFLADTGDTHGSYIIAPRIEYGTPLSRTVYAGIGVSADYAGKGYGRTYFGVTPAGSAASGLPVYSLPDSGFKNIRIAGFATKSLTGDLRRGLSIGAGLSYGRVLGKYADSPLVAVAGDRDQWAGAAGLAYSF